MTHESILTFYSQDHHRLDHLLGTFQRLKAKDPNQALKTLHEFRAGLEQHMAWEESILFSEYDAKVQDSDRSLTEQLLAEHAEILNVLDRLEEKLAAPGSKTEAEETRLVKALADHDRAEEIGLYAQLDHLLSNTERDEIFTKMKQAAWTEEDDKEARHGKSNG